MRRFTHLIDGLDNVQMSWDRWYKNVRRRLPPCQALAERLELTLLLSPSRRSSPSAPCSRRRSSSPTSPTSRSRSRSSRCASPLLSRRAHARVFPHERPADPAHAPPHARRLKAFTSVAVLGMSVMMGLDSWDKRKAVTVIGISAGVALASYGELRFVFSGFVFQCFGILFEATRLVAIQKLLQGLRMDPLVSLYYYAPVRPRPSSSFLPPRPSSFSSPFVPPPDVSSALHRRSAPSSTASSSCRSRAGRRSSRSSTRSGPSRSSSTATLPSSSTSASSSSSAARARLSSRSRVRPLLSFFSSSRSPRHFRAATDQAPSLSLFRRSAQGHPPRHGLGRSVWHARHHDSGASLLLLGAQASLARLTSTLSFSPQLVGYGLALAGLFIFKTKSEDLAVYWAQIKSLVGR